MGKQARQRHIGEDAAMAIGHMIRVSPRKLDLVAGLIRGQRVAAALANLSFSRRRIAREVKKVLQSAVANAENNHQLDVDRLEVAEASVGKALVLRRIIPRARGRASPIRKPFSRLRIIVRERRPEREAAAPEAKAQTPVDAAIETKEAAAKGVGAGTAGGKAPQAGQKPPGKRSSGKKSAGKKAPRRGKEKS
jgi:large subunit ribosomal protein L22